MQTIIPVWVESLKTLLMLAADFLPPIYVHGPPATGKTWLCLNVFPKEPPIAVTLHRGQPIEELRGMYVPSGSGFQWQDGPIMTAMRNGRTLVINEMGEASDDVISLLYAVLDRPESSAYTLPTGEAVKPAKGFRVIATGNADPSQLPEAIRSRFPIRFYASEPNPEAVGNLPSEIRGSAMATMVQDASRAVDPRQWQAWLDLRALVGEDKAFELVFADSARSIQDACKVAQS